MTATARELSIRKAAWRSVLVAGLALVVLSGAAQAANHALSVKVTDAKGRALPMATVEARAGRRAPSKVWADSKGIARMSLPAGTYRLTVMAGGHLPGRLANVRVPQQKSAKISLRSYLKSGMGAIVFHVLGSDGKPLVGATMQLLGPGGAVQRSTYNRDPYALTDIPAGRYKYAAYAKGHQQQRGSVTIPEGLTSRVIKLAKVRPAASCRATLNFFDKSTGKPLSGVKLVYGYRAKLRKELTVNRSASLGPHKPGIYWSEVWKHGYKKSQPTIQLEAARMSLDVYLEKETNKNVIIYVSCTDAKTGAVVRTQVTIKGPGINKTAWVAGSMSVFGSAQEGKWSVTARAAGYGDYRKDLNIVKRSAGVRIAIKLNKAAVAVPASARKYYATFVFTDAKTKRALNGVSYVITGPGTSRRGTVDRVLRLGPLAAGEHFFSFEKSGYYKFQSRPSLKANQRFPVALAKKSDVVTVAGPKNMLALTPVPSTGSGPLIGAQVVVQGPSGRKSQVISAKNIAAVFYNLTPGTYTYTVTVAGYSMISGRLRMGATSRETKILKLKPGAVSVGVLVVDEKSVPLYRATVQAIGPGGGRDKATTDRAGQARLKLYTGDWGVTASAARCQATSIKLKVPARGVQKFVLKFPRGGLDITVLSTARRRPLPGARVAIVSRRGSFNANADARGRCRFMNIPQDNYSYTVTAGGYATDSGRLALSTTRVLGKTISLRPASSDLTVLVLDAKTRKPVPGAGVVVRSRAGQKNATTDAAGRARFPGLKDGSYRLTASKSGYVSAGGTWQPSQGGARTLSLQRPQLGVKVLDATGKPIAGASVTAYWSSRSGFMRRTRSRNATVATGADGQAWMVITRATTARSVVVKAKGYKPAGRRSVRLPVELSFKLERIIPPAERKTTLSVKVLDAANGRPLAGAYVRLVVKGRRQQVEAPASGSVSFKDLPWGRYDFTVGKSGYSSQRRTVELKKAGTVTEVVKLAARRPKFVFTVLDSAGKPVAGAKLSLSWREQGTRTYRYKYDRGESNAKGQVLLYQATTRDLRALITVVKPGLPTTKRSLGRVSGNSPYRQTVRFKAPAVKTVVPAGAVVLTVTVTNWQRRPLPRATVSVFWGDPRTRKTHSKKVISDGTGKAAFSGIPKNLQLTLSVSAPGHKHKMQQVRQGTKHVALQLQRR
jgi:5-hydroxyisourate hydrolase-like protein (transthyretin family)